MPLFLSHSPNPQFMDGSSAAAADARSQQHLRSAAASLRASAREVVRQFLRDLWAVPPEALPAPQKRAVLLRLGQHVLVARRRAEAEARDAEVEALKGECTAARGLGRSCILRSVAHALCLRLVW